ncbi:MFS transporter [Streptomyces sp. NPDC018610]|uniref:MFS transporter n=1 Tax=Streptomyces sp. NPDC018610 TaxID=3365049 RepID=UPI0037BC58EE
MTARTPPRRQGRLFLSVGIDTVGAGVFMPLSLLFFVTVQNFSTAAAGIAITVGSVASFAVVPVCGRLIQSFGPKSCLVASNVLTACGYALYFVADKQFLVVVASFVVMASDRLYGAAWPTLAARIVEPEELTRWFASVNALKTTCLGAGTLGATGLMAVLGNPGLELALALNSVSSLSAAALLLGVVLPQSGRRDPRRARASMRGAVGDRPFLSLVASQTLLSAAWLIPTVAFPVFLVQTLHQPAYWPTAVVTARYVTIAALQMRVSRGLAGWTRSRILRLSIGVAALAIALSATVSSVPHALQGPLAVLVAVVLSTAELASKPTASAAAVAMAPTGDEGPYMSLFQLSWTVAYAVGPAAIGLGLSDPPELWAGMGICVAGSALAHRLRHPLRQHSPAAT